jgi:hypothetical protein
VFSIRVRRPIVGALLLLALGLLSVSPVLAHGHREVGEYGFTVGFMDEPVYTGQKSGLEFGVVVHDTDEPVMGLEETLQAEVIYQGQTRALPLEPQFGADGWYQSVFFPTAAGRYTFRIYGTINGMQVDESFTSVEDDFSEVAETSTGQFPTVLPAANDVAADAERGASAADQMPIALGLGILGAVLGVIALAVALLGRRRTT